MAFMGLDTLLLDPLGAYNGSSLFGHQNEAQANPSSSWGPHQLTGFTINQPLLLPDPVDSII